MRTVALLLVAITTGAAQPSPDAERILADMRQALGGDAALQNVKAFGVDGAVRRNLGTRPIESSIELLCSLPDKCLRASTQSSGPFTTTMTDGFTGDEPIRSIVSPGRTPPQDIYTGPNTPEAIAASRKAQALRNKQQFARILFALFGSSPAYPLTLTAGGPDQFNGRDMETVNATAADGYAMRLLIDRQTHLPAAVVWKARATVVMTKSQEIMVNRRSGEVREVTPPTVVPPPSLPPGAIASNGAVSGDPAAGQALVEHTIAFTDFKTADGLTWPGRITETVDGQPYEELRLGGFKINPRIDPGRFAPKKN